MFIQSSQQTLKKKVKKTKGKQTNKQNKKNKAKKQKTQKEKKQTKQKKQLTNSKGPWPVQFLASHLASPDRRRVVLKGTAGAKGVFAPSSFLLVLFQLQKKPRVKRIFHKT